MRISTIFLLLFSALSPLLLYAWTEPTAPPPEERRYIGSCDIEPLMDPSTYWSYPADGLFTWVATMTPSKNTFKVFLDCHSNIGKNNKTRSIFVLPCSAGRSPDEIIYRFPGTDKDDPVTTEYRKFNKEGIFPIREWEFSATLEKDYMMSSCVLFYYYDDVKDPIGKKILGL